MAEVTNDAENHNFATGPTHTEQPEFNNEGKVDQNAEQCYDTCPLPAKLIDDKTIELLNQLLESENVCLKKTVAPRSSMFKRRLKLNSSSLSPSMSKWCCLKITLQAPFLNVQKTFDRSRSSLGLHGNDVCSHQFRPRSSSNDF
ncbi:hypothetical protein Tco_0699079 [Tanacetum coccineum]